MYRVNCVFFDWGGTLVHPNKKPEFVYGKDLNARLSTLREDALSTIAGLLSNGIEVGIITNTKIPAADFKRALKETGLDKIFRPDLVLVSNEPELCKKPCYEIFEEAIHRSVCDSANLLFVGNSYGKDILGAQQLGLQTALIDTTSRHKRHERATYKISELSDLLRIIL
jgi:FMN phosphatase YigB (HAD superfamily)